MTWRVYAPGSVPDDLDLSSVFRIHTVERVPRSCPLAPHTSSGMGVLIHPKAEEHPKTKELMGIFLAMFTKFGHVVTQRTLLPWSLGFQLPLELAAKLAISHCLLGLPVYKCMSYRVVGFQNNGLGSLLGIPVQTTHGGSLSCGRGPRTLKITAMWDVSEESCRHPVEPAQRRGQSCKWRSHRGWNAQALEVQMSP